MNGDSVPVGDFDAGLNFLAVCRAKNGVDVRPCGKRCRTRFLERRSVRDHL
jgi:hypothetical protein